MDMEALKAKTPLEVLCYWIQERHNIFLKREQGQPWPWTEDPLLQRNKFANVYREKDKTTLWMRENITNPHLGDDPALMVFNCALFRMVGTIEYSQAIGGWQGHFDPEKLISIGEKMREEGKLVFTAAYIISGGKSGVGNKLRMVIEENIMEVWRRRKHLAIVASESKHMSTVFKELLGLPGYGGSGFMAYELVTDLRWTQVFGVGGPSDIMTWSNPGPGAMEGLNLIHNRPLNYKLRNDLALEEMRDLLVFLPTKLDESLPTFELRDVEHCLCELSKYWRCLQGEGSTRSLYYNPNVGMPDPRIARSHKKRGRKAKVEVVDSFWTRLKKAWAILFAVEDAKPRRGRPANDETYRAKVTYQNQAGEEIDPQEEAVGGTEPVSSSERDELSLTPPTTETKRSHKRKGDPSALPRRRGRPPGVKNRPKEQR